MNDRDYLEIILNGFIEDSGGYLTNHFYREWKKAEGNHYSLAEFFRGLIRQQKGLTAYIDRQIAERRHEVSIIRGIWEREGKDIKELEGQEDIQYSINLLHLTGDNKYLGFTLWQSDINYIGGQIADAFEKADKEINTGNEPEKKIKPKTQDDKIDETIPVFDFGLSIINRKVPFEIEIICKYDTPSFELRYSTLNFGERETQIEVQSLLHFENQISKGCYNTEDFKKIDNDNCVQYYKSYADGFVKGYNEFDKTIDDTTKIFGADIQSKVQKVFQFIIAPVPLLAAVNFENFEGNRIPIIKNKTCYDNGVKAGEKYKAWFYIIENPTPFVLLFRSHKPFIGFYRKAYEYWSKEPGGEGVSQRLQKLLQEIDDTKQNSKTETESNKKNRNKPVRDYKTLEEIFVSTAAFKMIMDKLIEEDLIDKTSLKWIKFEPGYKSKIVALLIHLWHGKYFNCTELPTAKQIASLIQNGFGISVSERTIKGEKIETIRKEFAFIKYFKP